VKGLVVSTLRHKQQAPLSIAGEVDGGDEYYEGRTGDMVADELFKVEYRQSITGFGSYLNSGTSFNRPASWLGLLVLISYFICSTIPNRKIMQGRTGRGRRLYQLHRAL
jgi:hypothetical protein